MVESNDHLDQRRVRWGQDHAGRRAARRLPDAIAFDPEYVGSSCEDGSRHASGDFQDIPMWRQLVADFAVGMRREYGRPLVIPMVLVNAEYRDEIFGPIAEAGESVVQPPTTVILPGDQTHSWGAG